MARTFAQQDLALTEPQVHVAYVYNFARFVEWPEERKQIEVCYYGSKELGEAMAEIEGKTVAGKSIQPVAEPAAGRLASCAILFFADNDPDGFARLVSGATERGVLTVTALRRDARPQGIINLVRERRKLRFLIDLDKAERAELRISSRLLQLAENGRSGGQAW